MLIGDAMLAAAAVLWGATTVLIKASPLVPDLAGQGLALSVGCLRSGAAAGVYSNGEHGVAFITPLIVGSLIYQVIWIASVTYLAWFWLLHHYPASRLASFTFLTPLFVFRRWRLTTRRNHQLAAAITGFGWRRDLPCKSSRIWMNQRT